MPLQCLSTKASFHLTPHPTSSHSTQPHLTSPHLTSPHLTSPHLTSPHLTSPHTNYFVRLLQDGSPHLPEATHHQPDPTVVHSAASETGIQQAVTSLLPIPAPSAAVAAQDMSHASEVDQALDPTVHRAAAEQADSDGPQEKTDGTVTVTLLRLDTESPNREDR